MPEYAIKEFKAGPLRAWIWCHNKFTETRSFADTQTAIERVSATLQRNFSASARQALRLAAQADKDSFARVLDLQEQGDRILDSALADRYRYYLRRKIIEAWQRRRAIVSEVSMPLVCFTEGDLREEKGGGLFFDRYSCPNDSICSVARELSRHREHVGLLLKVVKEQPPKPENQKRYQALRHLFRTPNRPFSDAMCRSLGDAVFAIMAPPGSIILTTNLKDHRPLADALGKIVKEP